MTWNADSVERELNEAFAINSELKLLEVLKRNSFLFYELYSRKYGIQPLFHELSFGAKLRCDFAWLNDNSDSPEWVLVEIEKPRMRLFNTSGKPSAELNAALEQVREWDRYFHEYPAEKKRIFGAVGRFRYVLVAGSSDDWKIEAAMKWRSHQNSISNIEIRSSDVFLRPLTILREHPDELWSFEENPVSFGYSKLENYWKEYGYMDRMRQMF